MPDNVDAASIEIFEILTKYSPWNANSVINIDIVKPIPDKKAIPIICKKLTLEDNFASLSFKAIYVNRVIPTDFPINKPKKIPISCATMITLLTTKRNSFYFENTLKKQEGIIA